MSQVNGNTSQVTGSSTSPIRKVQSMDDLNSSDFLQLMIKELQQQDPLNPMDNNQLVQQINSIRQLSSTTALTDTLSSVLIGQNIATASGMIGKNVKALADDGSEVSGKVDRVAVTVDTKDENKREVRVHIGGQEVKISNVREIIP
jgi:flagellar basal-body rod modification protein FlgD